MAKYIIKNTLPFYPKRYFSHFLIIIAVIVSVIGFMFPGFIQYFGLHKIVFTEITWMFILGQIVFYQFLHGNMLHILMNVYFLYQAGPEVESRMSPSRFQLFFLSNTIFVALALWFLAPYSLTIGISGFCMALLSYLWIDLASTRHPMANQILIMLVVNILFGLIEHISFVGHFFGAVWGIMWWTLFRRR